MHNSGLFFADSNAAWHDDYRPGDFSEGYEDGILRVEEIETQNLASCRLVVLSACETGLGEIKGDEGVYGLQRAFKLAGADNILMSLWSVPDAATEELMKRFYESLLTEDDIDKAFSSAQKSMKNSKKPIYGVRDRGGFALLHYNFFENGTNIIHPFLIRLYKYLRFTGKRRYCQAMVVVAMHRYKKSPSRERVLELASAYMQVHQYKTAHKLFASALTALPKNGVCRRRAKHALLRAPVAMVGRLAGSGHGVLA